MTDAQKARIAELDAMFAAAKGKEREMTDDEIRALRDSATKGPWESSADKEPLPFAVMPRVYGEDTLLAEVGNCSLDQDAWEANARLIAAAPALANAALEARAELATVKAERDIQECLYDSVFQSGVKLGWNFGVTGDEAGLKAATSSTEHVAEIKRIRAALQSAPTQKEQSDE